MEVHDGILYIVPMHGGGHWLSLTAPSLTPFCLPRCEMGLHCSRADILFKKARRSCSKSLNDLVCRSVQRTASDRPIDSACPRTTS